MDPDEWAALNRLLDSALDVPAGERSAWVDRLGPEHEAFKPRLRRLFDASSDADPDLSLPQFDEGGEGHAAGDDSHAPNATVGPYRLIRKLADGGMGTVWLAERSDGLIARHVAVKLPRGVWQRASLLDRMAREREILARLEHQHIGRLYDAGLADDGQPYLALEYIEGRHIDDYCREQGLGIGGRLGLFLQVLDAVAHAHARLVVHRDIKPSNILVTADGQVKLLDFGIAKLLTEGMAPGTALTEISGRPLTPGYASPEQAAGEPLTIASDVYSLGVVLYELLTSERPRKIVRDAHGMAAGAAFDTDPVLPSKAAGPGMPGAGLRGDLDTVVLKALKHDPAERYATVNAFADDIRRHQQGHPILARPDSAWYRASKFARRHALPLAAAAAVLLAVFVGAGVAVWQARVARAEQRRAEEVKEFITSIFEGASPYAAAGEPLTAVDLLEQAHNRIERMPVASPELRVELLTLVGSSLAELTALDKAEPLLASTVEESIRTLGPDHPLTLRARTVLALTHRYVGSPDAAAEELSDLLPRLRRQPGMVEDLVEALESDAGVAMTQGQWDRAVASSTEMLERARRDLGADHHLTLAAMFSLVQANLLAGRVEEAAAEADRAFPLMVEAHRAEPNAPEVMEARELYGRVLTAVGRLDEGITHMSNALADGAALFGETSLLVGFYSANLASRQLQAGDLEAALATADRAIAVTAVTPGPASGVHAFAHHTRGQILIAARRSDEALAQMDLAIEKLNGAGDREQQSVPAAEVQRTQALAEGDRIAEAVATLESIEAPNPRILGRVLRLAGRYSEALASQRRALAAVPTDHRANRARSLVLTEIGLNHLELGQTDAAIESLTEALTLSRGLERRPIPDHADILVGLGRARLARDQPAEALPLLEEAVAFWKAFDPGSRWAAEAGRWFDRANVARGRAPSP